MARLRCAPELAYIFVGVSDKESSSAEAGPLLLMTPKAGAIPSASENVFAGVGAAVVGRGVVGTAESAAAVRGCPRLISLRLCGVPLCLTFRCSPSLVCLP